MLSTSLTVSEIHEVRVLLRLLKIIECEQHEHCLRWLSISSISTAQDNQVWAAWAWLYNQYIVWVKSLINLTC